MNNSIILFDGHCNLCNSSVNFIIDRDPEKRFKFTSLQSEIGEEISNKYKIDKSKTDSVILVEADRVYTKSSAALKIAKYLRGIWKLAYVFIIIPKFIRDFFYDIIAKNRYKWFGKKNECRLPTPELKERFL